MDVDDRGLARPLANGEYVILTTGAIARAEAAYPQGYTGPVKISLDGQPMSELAGSLTLPDESSAIGSPSGAAVFEDAGAEDGENRGESHRMRD